MVEGMNERGVEFIPVVFTAADEPSFYRLVVEILATFGITKIHPLNIP